CMIDRLVEPHRAKMITGYEEVKRRGLQAGASGVAISGAGPTMIAVVNDEKVDAEYVAKAMAEGFESVGVDAEAYAVKPAKGAEVLTSE
ncbi:homoserine kinase, partial [Candidatus Bathyarchaeota archaeon]